MSRAVFLCVLVAGLVAACAGPEPGRGPGPGTATVNPPQTPGICRHPGDPNCTITVLVSDTIPCVVTVSDPKLEVTSGYGNAQITWKLDDAASAAGYRFAPSSVVFLDWNSDVQWHFHKQQSNPGTPTTPGVLVWTDIHTDSGVHHPYAVVVFKDDGAGSFRKCASDDPFILNN